MCKERAKAFVHCECSSRPVLVLEWGKNLDETSSSVGDAFGAPKVLAQLYPLYLGMGEMLRELLDVLGLATLIMARMRNVNGRTDNDGQKLRQQQTTGAHGHAT